MDTVLLLHEYVKGSHAYLEATLGDPTPEEALWLPHGRATTIAANYAHLVCAEDYLVNTLAAGRAPPLRNDDDRADRSQCTAPMGGLVQMGASTDG